jgi:hypothetical protein
MQTFSMIRAVLVSMILCFSSAALAAEECPAAATSLNGDQFFTEEYSGRVAWLQFGPNSSTYYPLDGCNKLYVRSSNIL